MDNNSRPMRRTNSDNSERRRRNSLKKKNSRTGRIIAMILLVFTIAIVLLMVAFYPVLMINSENEATIRIPRGATSQNVADSLTKHLGEDFASNVMKVANLRSVDYSKRNGLYVIPSGSNALAAARKLTSGAQTPVRITINGFRSMPLLIERISNKMEFPADSLRAVLEDNDLLRNYGLNLQNAMALFVDDTYEVYWTASARQLIEKIGENYLKLWNADNTRIAAELNLTPADIMIVASIADEETNIAEEKGIVGRLYINRLHKNMRLQADPTVRFALGDFSIKRITKSDLKTNSPYNTYIHGGLPPGPIRTTSAKTVTGILQSTPNNYIYMCAKEDFSGAHNFTSSYDEHLRNAAKYQAELNKRGIKR